MPYLSTRERFLRSIANDTSYFLSSHNFADFTSPLLIAAQTALLQQLRDRQNSIEQPHFDATVADLGRPIHPDDFYTLRPDKLFRVINRPGDDITRTHSASTMSLGARLDPKGTDFYARKSSLVDSSLSSANLFRNDASFGLDQYSPRRRVQSQTSSESTGQDLLFITVDHPVSENVSLLHL